MLLTPNYLLKKIELADSPPDITVINANWDIIDAKLKEAFNSITAIKIPVTSVSGKTGAVTLAATDVGLGNVTNESKATMFTNPTFTGIPVAPTAVAGTNTTQVATTAFVTAAVGAKNSITGNAGTATKLATPRTINGVSFDGSANITIPASGIRTTDGKTLEEFKTSTNASLEQKANETDATRLTTSKTVTGAINELFTNASNGKTLVANAVTNKGVEASPTDTFALLATKIGQISTGKKFASGSMVRSGVADFELYTSTSKISSVDYIEVTNLDFLPSYIIAIRKGSNGSVAIYSPTVENNDLILTVGVSGDNTSTAIGRKYKLKAPAYVQYGGFKIPTPTILSASEYYWFAFE